MTPIECTAGSRYLSVGHSPTGISLTFEPTWERTLGSAVVRTRRVGGLRPASPASIQDVDARRDHFGDHSTLEAGDFTDVLSTIDLALDHFRKERLHPHAVEEILGITAALDEGRPASQIRVGIVPRRPTINPFRAPSGHGNRCTGSPTRGDRGLAQRRRDRSPASINREGVGAAAFCRSAKA
jgi:hypothetical protein